MPVATKLCNPTPFEVKIPYNRGIDIVLPPDGSIDLTMQQTDDFRPGKPGSEAVRQILEFEGVFLVDTDRSYDSQALNACQVSLEKKKERLKEFMDRNKTNRLQAGHSNITDDVMNELARTAGYNSIMKQIDMLERRVATLSKVVNADDSGGRVKENLDPERTCFIVMPPRQFESKTQLAMFLDENPDIKEMHENYMAELNKAND